MSRLSEAIDIIAKVYQDGMPFWVAVNEVSKAKSEEDVRQMYKEVKEVAENENYVCKR